MVGYACLSCYLGEPRSSTPSFSWCSDLGTSCYSRGGVVSSASPSREPVDPAEARRKSKRVARPSTRVYGLEWCV
jgi:hypothetical protein